MYNKSANEPTNDNLHIGFMDYEIMLNIKKEQTCWKNHNLKQNILKHLLKKEHTPTYKMN